MLEAGENLTELIPTVKRRKCAFLAKTNRPDPAALALSGDVNGFAMAGEVSSLAVREALRQPRHRRFGEPQAASKLTVEVLTSVNIEYLLHYN